MMHSAGGSGVLDWGDAGISINAVVMAGPSSLDPAILTLVLQSLRLL